ncbi:MAG: histidinol-phosphatase [Bacteroidetes bacterium]|nr:MAG: histidinol-phosphatase [Bacteroidota bacterium]
MYKADLHIHTVLSPCGSLDMSPSNIVRTALDKELDIIGITDHNSTLQCKSVLEAAKDKPITIYCGVEITTKEEAHCLAFFDGLDTLALFQHYLDEHLPHVSYNPDKFGYQVVVDAEENIIYEEERWLVPGINQNIDQIAQKVHELNGLFIPAHINKMKNSLISQLGFIPFDLEADAYEISRHITREEMIKQQPQLANKTILQDSDAHFINDIGSVFNTIEMEDTSFEAFRKALKQENNCKVIAS